MTTLKGGAQVAGKGSKMNIINEKINFLPSTNFLDVFAKLQKRLLASSCLSVSRSVRPSGRLQQLVSQLTDFHEYLYLNLSRNAVDKIQVSLKSYKNNGSSHVDN